MCKKCVKENLNFQHSRCVIVILILSLSWSWHSEQMIADDRPRRVRRFKVEQLVHQMSNHYIHQTHAPITLCVFFFKNPFLCDSCKSRNIWLPGVFGIKRPCILIPTTPRDLCHTFRNIQLSSLCTDYNN